ncbi:MAG: hydroxymethylglutaryl-CoA lyase [Myxococcales bacterium]|nr:hydroxymethylglutaryl-CoA lyase [Myxococcales bacterium]
MFDALPPRVRVYEVGPRDGLQNEAAVVPTEGKLRLIGALTAAGLPRIEITSFVNPRWIPPLADAEFVAQALRAEPAAVRARYTALVPNERGLDRALAAGLGEVAVFMSASETHNRRNINKSREETWPAFEPVFARCAEAGVAVRAYVSTAWGCPYEGAVAPEVVRDVAARLLAMGAYEISLGDTIGVGTPLQTRRLLDVLLAALPVERLAMHMHDTRGTALANCLVGLEAGITTFDASVGGLGGCPYAPGASGNLATEDLVYLLHGMGIETGIDLDRLVDAGLVARDLLDRDLPGRALAALAASRKH